MNLIIMNTTNGSNRIQRVKTMLDRDNRISVKVGNLDDKTFRNLDQLILYTLQFYNYEMWFDYFSVLARSLLFLAINSCKLKNCSVRMVKNNSSFLLQIYSENFMQLINKREFVEYINELGDSTPQDPYYKDLFFLKKILEVKQLRKENITYYNNKIELEIPGSDLTEEKWNELRKSIVNSVDTLPPLMENLMKLEEMIHSGVFDMNAIASQVGTDPGLTFDIIKTVNSGAYFLNTKIDDIQSALKYLGLRELYNLMLTLSIKKVLSVNDEGMKKIWQHSYKTAYYACHIANRIHAKIAHTDSVYTTALLHDIGKFPISCLYTDENVTLLDFCKIYHVNLQDLEDAISGIGHSETGYLMGEKWKLPDSLKLVMKYHHNPDEAPEKIRSLNDIVYIADLLASNMEESISSSVLERYNFESVEELIDVFGYLSEDFESNNIWK